MYYHQPKITDISMLNSSLSDVSNTNLTTTNINSFVNSVKKKNGISTYKYTKTPELFQALVSFYMEK